MEIYHAAIVALVLAVVAAAPVRGGGDEPVEVEAAVLAQLSAALGRRAGADFSHNAGRGPWRLVCGVPLEPDGTPFDLARSKLADSEYGAHFCALARLGDAGVEIVEFDIGSNDMPAVDWIERYDLPPGILTGP
jgi:hypothetical protein